MFDYDFQSTLELRPPPQFFSRFSCFLLSLFFYCSPATLSTMQVNSVLVLLLAFVVVAFSAPSPPYVQANLYPVAADGYVGEGVFNEARINVYFSFALLYITGLRQYPKLTITSSITSASIFLTNEGLA